MLPTDVTPSGRVTLFRDEHSPNAESLMAVTLLGMVTDSSEAYPSNAPVPMVLTPSGIRYEVRFFPRGTRNMVFLSLSKRMPSA